MLRTLIYMLLLACHTSISQLGLIAELNFDKVDGEGMQGLFRLSDETFSLELKDLGFENSEEPFIKPQAGLLTYVLKDSISLENYKFSKAFVNDDQGVELRADFYQFNSKERVGKITEQIEEVLNRYEYLYPLNYSNLILVDQQVLIFISFYGREEEKTVSRISDLFDSKGVMVFK